MIAISKIDQLKHNHALEMTYVYYVHVDTVDDRPTAV